MRQIVKLLALSPMISVLAGCGSFENGSVDASSSSSLSSRNTFALNSVSAACDDFKAKMSSGADVTLALQQCVDSAPEGSTLELPAGVANISGTIRVAKKLTLKTVGIAAGTMCDTADRHACFELRATAAMMSSGGEGLLAVTGTGASIQSIVVNGNRGVRLQTGAANAAKNGDNGQGYNMQVQGIGISVEGVVSKQALCGTGMMVKGSGLMIRQNAVVQNGDHRDLFSDGMTVLDASSSTFKNNLFIDNTDVDFIFGGCQNCLIQANTLKHNSTFAGSSFAAMMLHAWPDGATSGNYTGTDVSGNAVDCGAQRRCGIGLYLGAESWYSGPLFGGFFHDNSVTNALNGFLVERASGLIRIKDNKVTNSGGVTWTSKQLVEQAYPYNIPYRANVQIEDTAIPLSSYQQVSLSRSIPNFWNKEVALDSGGAASASSSTEAEVVKAVYRDLLRREPDTAGLQNWTAYLQAGHSRAELETQIRAMAEYQNLNANPNPLLAAMFNSILHRVPDSAAINGTRNQSCAFIGNMVANSPEANGIYAPLSNRAFISYIYSGILGRAADADGLTIWTAEVDSGRMSRTAVINNFLAGGEFANRCKALGL